MGYKCSETNQFYFYLNLFIYLFIHLFIYLFIYLVEFDRVPKFSAIKKTARLRDTETFNLEKSSWKFAVLSSDES